MWAHVKFIVLRIVPLQTKSNVTEMWSVKVRLPCSTGTRVFDCIEVNLMFIGPRITVIFEE